MKGYAWMVGLLVLFVATTALAKERVVQRKAGDYSVTIRMEKDPPLVGTNRFEIVVTDKTGKAVTDATVQLAASMPAMPGMPAMENRAEAKIDGDKYKGKIEISMSGSWNMSVRITQGGKTATARWTVDAR